MDRRLVGDLPGTQQESRRAEAPAANAPAGAQPAGGFVLLDGEEHYRISGCDRLPPFLMTLASDGDLWMFVTSGGGLTAGRGDADGAIFPYETVDRLHDGHHHTGPLTLVRIERRDGPSLLWQPFAEIADPELGIRRNLYKNVIGSRLLFEEVAPNLGLAFRYRWAAGDEFGWVRTAWLENRSATPVHLTVLDGLRNVLPWGAPQALHQQAGVLVDAYKKSEIDPETGLGIFSLTSRITDRAEAAEVLRAAVVWCRGLDGARVHLPLAAVAAFRRGAPLPEPAVLDGCRGNYLVSASLALEPGGQARWHVVADTGRSHAEVVALRETLRADADLEARLAASLARASENLLRNVGGADGLQLTEHAEAAAHHFASVLFNNMRGGTFARNHDLPAADLADFVRTRNRETARRQASFFGSLPEWIGVDELLAAAERTGDADLERLCHEYLPLGFGRRHGDPSRPWNAFAIRVRNQDGSRALYYEGNWRDIFQNWEALCASYPAFLPGMVAKFVNASTLDGFNPYRLTRDGIDWETIDPDDPWSYIGYWGDHQIVYLLKFLEALARRQPGRLEGLLPREIFSYADVPYRIAPYADIVLYPRRTIDFDADRAARSDERVRGLGTDGKLVAAAGGAVHHASLLEKLLVPVLAKLSNLVPDGGIWMNTQRPEWNDANNALVGNGVSVVTLCYLRRHLAFLEGLLERAGAVEAPVAREVVAWYDQIGAILAAAPPPAGEPLPARERRRLLDALGQAFSAYREQVYARGLSGKEPLAAAEVAAFCRAARRHLERAIRLNRRADGLYHAYLLLDLADDRAVLRPLPEMLEGQVAALSSGLLDAGEAVALLERLYASPLYRADQRSFLLYPARELPGFLARNAVPERRARAVPLLAAALDAGEGSLLVRDATGVCRFSGDVRNAEDLGAALDRLAGRAGWSEAVARDRRAVLELFEEVFRHRSYTGRSGAMYAYEGLGCVYWHMVGKLLLAVQEVLLRAEDEGQPAAAREALARLYYRIRSGLGFEKTVAEHGAFPTDPYSHTPAGGGARQPGMTGQVKEQILARLGELGVRVEAGAVEFRPSLLRAAEFLRRPDTFRYRDLQGEARSLRLETGSLAFTFCQVPVVYERSEDAGWVEVLLADGSTRRAAGCGLGPELSRALLGRSGRLERIRVGVPAHVLCRA